ncbi:MAG: hypothetical protein MK033_12640 [Candidatus Caenarcaniphilales bacterium]|nr:hypothetical protein [Candidatus Caenarcaniphilales bacterium]
MGLVHNISAKSQQALNNLIPEIRYVDLVEQDSKGLFTPGGGFKKSGPGYSREQQLLDLAKIVTFEPGVKLLKENLVRVKRNINPIYVDSDQEDLLLDNFKIYKDQIQSFQRLVKQYPKLEMIPFEVKLEKRKEGSSDLKSYDVVYVEPNITELFETNGIDLARIFYHINDKDEQFNKNRIQQL